MMQLNVVNAVMSIDSQRVDQKQHLNLMKVAIVVKALNNERSTQLNPPQSLQYLGF